ncbi:MAG: ABC-type Fe3+/spermidine/putrescine transport system ATPase subunit [Candidatus Paceibacteria bacterium]|jgi:ABC-type Fe3+/spermidine/putrescine transport system ATPase subunit
MIRLEQLAVRFGTFQLHDVSLELPQGRTLALLGPSGAGKSILLETIMGVRQPASGRVLLEGVDAGHMPPEARNIAYIPQDLALFPHLSVRENILFGSRARGRVLTESALDSLVQRLRLEGVIARKDVGGLSGGERQRVSLARALAVEPRVLFMDEPFSALDQARRMDAVELLRDVKAELGTTIVLVTHDLEEASVLADDVAVLLDGTLAQHGSRDSVFQRPESRAVALFLMMKNIFERDELPLETLERDANCPWVGVRPEETVLLTDTDGRPNCFTAVVEDAVLLASRWSIRFRVPIGERAVRIEASLQPGRFRVLQPVPGRELVVHLPPEALVGLER